jgi:hypothetical protein
MKYNIIEFIIILTAVYLLMAFVIGTFNCFNWGIIGRSAYILISVGIFIANKKLSDV